MDQVPILKINQLTKKYDDITAVNRISFAVQPGEIIGLLGPNGAGKTTTINMILGILEPTAGDIILFGKNMRRHACEVSQLINFAAVYAHMPYNLTVRQNLYVFGLLYNVPNLRTKLKSLLKEFDLEKFADTKSGLLSSGEVSRLNLAKAVMNDPKMLLLDEPTASLDPSVAEQVRQIIKDYTKQNHIAVLWTSHNMKEIEEVCDQVLFLSHGKILLTGNPKTLPQERGKKDLEELFISVAREPLTYE